MPRDRLPQRRRRHRVNIRSASSAVQARASTERLLLTIPCPLHAVLIIPPVTVFADRTFSVGRCDRIARVGGSRPLVSTAFPFVRPTVASEERVWFNHAVAAPVAANCTGGVDEGKHDSSHAALFY
jgi:hypothetical protein